MIKLKHILSLTIIVFLASCAQSQFPYSSKDKKAVKLFEKAQKLVKTVEAGYSDDKGDDGNYINLPNGQRRFIGTNHGVSAPVLLKYYKDMGIKKSLTKKDMMNLSYKTAFKIFKRNYWDAQRLGVLKDQNVANIIYDGCINQGIGGMRKILVNAFRENGIHVSSDNIFSREVLSKVNKVNQKKLFNSIKKFRRERYRGSGTFKRHGRGWLNRLNSISYESEKSKNDNV